MRLARPAAAAAAALSAIALTATPASAAAPNDPLYAKQYGPQQVHADQAWATSTGAGAVIAVVDTGVDLGHQDLQGKLVPGATFIGCNPSCGNGDWKGPDGVGQANDAHGTHVSGIAAAAGNDSVPLCNEPGFDAGVVCVVSTDKRELRSAFSSGPIKPDLLAVSAPGGSLVPVCGEDIVSSVPAGTSSSGATCGYGNNYDEYAGTSMATPHVAGVAALLAAQGRSVDNIYSTLTSTARTPGAGVRGTFTPVYGYGIVDAAAAVAAPTS